MLPGRDNIAAPDLPQGLAWVGAEPESMPALTAGGPALVHFLDFAQLNSVRTLPDYEEVLRRCLDEVLRLVRLADDLLTLTRVEGGVVGGKRVPVDLDDVTGRAAGRKQAVATGRGDVGRP